MYTHEDICAFVAEKVGVDRSQIEAHTRLRDDLGVCGDDFFELMDAFSERFHVDLSPYRWYFHHRDEGSWLNVGGLFFRPPYDLVEHISITPELLLESANAGRWILDYPPHVLPKIRHDGLVNLIVLGVGVLLILSGALWKLFK